MNTKTQSNADSITTQTTPDGVHPAPLSPIAAAKKRRADSPLWAMSDDKQSALVAMLDHHTLDEMVIVLSEADDEHVDLTPQELFDLGQRRLMARAIRLGDDKAWARMHRLRQQEELVSLQRRRVQALEERNQLLREHGKSSLPVPNHPRWSPVGQEQPAEFANSHTPVPSAGRATLPRSRNTPPPQSNAPEEPNTVPPSDPSVLSVPFPSSLPAVAAGQAEALPQAEPDPAQLAAHNPASSRIIPPLAA